ncbi:TM2 domain-containing protein [Actinomyces howellii]|uniref:TM2 domain n=1 Tax=Actinomyces howellii TaxID=52771 RepID=A0A448HGY6_9ACTO|nr:TM2 domain-containing protein [Actinomyces howellii]VEG28209.1 TM2 domain [Actinomyces howellii]
MSIPSLPAPSQKNKVVVWLLAFFLGHLGAHNFYLGETKEGIYHLVLLAVYAVFFYVLGGISSIFVLLAYVVALANWGWAMYQAYQASQRPDVV